MKEIARMHVWSNGKTIRRYCAQDKRHERNPDDIVRKSPDKGYRKMIAVLYEIDAEVGASEDEIERHRRLIGG